MKHQVKFLAVAAALVASQSALAQSAGTWMARIGASTIAPQVSSGDLSAPSFPNSKTDVGSANQLTGGITYMVTNNVAVDIPLALPFKHKLYGAGALASLGQIGDVQALPVTAFVQYRFMDAKSQVRPYVGLGATYAYFFNPAGSGALTALTNPGGTPTKITIDSKFAITPQVGVTIALNEKWFADIFFSKTNLSTTTKLSTGQTVDVALNPNSYGFTVGYSF